jgi:membrane protein implicated in regulation of membrane protease activity
LSFVGTMGVFLIGSLVWMTAILIDKNRVFPKWFGYFNLCNALTEVVVSPAWLFKKGVFAWNGLIAWWIDMVVFGIYTGVFIFLLRRMIQREDFGIGPLPAVGSNEDNDPSGLARAAQ